VHGRVPNLDRTNPMGAVWEVAQVRRLGVDIRTGVTVGTYVAPAELLAPYSF
jgi:hypothetical protein